MISRRDFLKILGVGGVAVFAPIPLFDTATSATSAIGPHPTITINGHTFYLYEISISQLQDWIDQGLTYNEQPLPAIRGQRSYSVEIKLGIEANEILMGLISTNNSIEFTINHPNEFKALGSGWLSSIEAHISHLGPCYTSAEIAGSEIEILDA